MLKTCECTACMYGLSHNDRLLEEKNINKIINYCVSRFE